MGPSVQQLLIVLAIVILIFGAKKIPELAKGLGSGIKNFKKAVKEDDETPQAESPNIITTQPIQNTAPNMQASNTSAQSSAPQNPPQNVTTVQPQNTTTNQG